MAKAQGWGDWAVSGAQLEKEAGKSEWRVDSEGDGKTDSFMQGQCMIRFAFQEKKKNPNLHCREQMMGGDKINQSCFQLWRRAKWGPLMESYDPGTKKTNLQHYKWGRIGGSWWLLNVGAKGRAVLWIIPRLLLRHLGTIHSLQMWGGGGFGGPGTYASSTFNRYSGYGVSSRELSGQQLKSGIICIYLSPWFPEHQSWKIVPNPRHLVMFIK